VSDAGLPGVGRTYRFFGHILVRVDDAGQLEDVHGFVAANDHPVLHHPASALDNPGHAILADLVAGQQAPARPFCIYCAHDVEGTDPGRCVKCKRCQGCGKVAPCVAGVVWCRECAKRPCPTSPRYRIENPAYEQTLMAAIEDEEK